MSAIAVEHSCLAFQMPKKHRISSLGDWLTGRLGVETFAIQKFAKNPITKIRLKTLSVLLRVELGNKDFCDNGSPTTRIGELSCSTFLLIV